MRRNLRAIRHALDIGKQAIFRRFRILFLKNQSDAAIVFESLVVRIQISGAFYNGEHVGAIASITIEVGNLKTDADAADAVILQDFFVLGGGLIVLFAGSEIFGATQHALHGIDVAQRLNLSQRRIVAAAQNAWSVEQI